MKITIKNLKYASFASHETHCFEASLYIDGKKYGTVSNDGNGGPHHFDHPWSEIKKIEDTLAKKIIDTGYGKIPNSLELVVDDLINEHFLDKEVKKVLKNITYLGDNKEIHSLPSNYKPDARNLAGIKTAKWWKKSYILLNELPFDEVKKHFK